MATVYEDNPDIISFVQNYVDCSGAQVATVKIRKESA
jgi:hypothetical protein